MKYQVGDIVEFNYDSAENAKAKRTILLLKHLSRNKWKCELIHDTIGNYRLEDGGVFYLEETSDTKLVWRAKTGLDNVTAP